MSNTGCKKFGWFALFIAFFIGYSFGGDNAKDKAQIEIRRLNDEIEEKDSKISRLTKENQQFKFECPKDEAKEQERWPFR